MKVLIRLIFSLFFVLLSAVSFTQEFYLNVLFLDKKDKLINDPKICHSADTLNLLVEELKAFPEIVIKIYCHTDFNKSEDFNMKLTENRARLIYSALVDFGIDPRRIIPEGRGEREPRKWIGENGTEYYLSEEFITSFKKSDKQKYKKLNALNNCVFVQVVRQDFDPTKETMTIEEAKKKYNYKSYLKY
jgi:hypothetical protein